MKKRQWPLNLLQRLFRSIDKRSARAESNPVHPYEMSDRDVKTRSMSEQHSIDHEPSLMRTKDTDMAGLPDAPDLNHIPSISEEIRDLLGSEDWEEVNQGLELLVASMGTEAMQPFGTLIDVASLSVVHPELWHQRLGIRPIYEINAVAKLADLTGGLQQICSIRLNSVAFADEIQLDLSLLSGACSLEELIINGGTVTGLAGLGQLSNLRKLVLMAESIDWDPDDHRELFSGLSDLHSLSLCQWPWDDLTPLGALNELEHLDLRGGELSTLDGLQSLQSLTNLSLGEFYSLSEFSEIGELSELRSLALSLANDGVMSLEGFENLVQLRSIELKASCTVDITALANLAQLTNVSLDGSRGFVGLGALAGAPNLRQLKLNDVPLYTIGEGLKSRFDRQELERLCVSWKSLHIRSKSVSSLFFKGADLSVALLGISVIEAITEYIDADDFSLRLDRIFSRWGPELRSRAYWPSGIALGRYSQTTPIGQWLNRAVGHVPSATLEHIATTLAERLPAVPQRV